MNHTRVSLVNLLATKWEQFKINWKKAHPSPKTQFAKIEAAWAQERGYALNVFAAQWEAKHPKPVPPPDLAEQSDRWDEDRISAEQQYRAAIYEIETMAPSRSAQETIDAIRELK